MQIIKLTIIMCSLWQNTCINPHTFEEGYSNTYDCLMDGYKKSIEKTEEIGRKEVNKHGIYMKFYCKEENRGDPADYKIYITGDHLFRGPSI
mgnify:FL=1|tara:strand:- start:277 stop:552 length:276 start_codon:yes stop_codon:yes gene_type:complete